MTNIETEEILITLRHPGEFFGEMALVDNSPQFDDLTVPVAAVE